MPCCMSPQYIYLIGYVEYLVYLHVGRAVTLQLLYVVTCLRSGKCQVRSLTLRSPLLGDLLSSNEVQSAMHLPLEDLDQGSANTFDR